MSVSQSVNVYGAQGAVVFQRVSNGIHNIQPIVKPNDQRTGRPLHWATQGAAVSTPDQQLWREFDQELGAAGEAMTSLLMRHHVGEIKVSDEAVGSPGRWRRQSRLLRGLLLVLVGRTSRGLPVCLTHFRHRVGRDWGFCFDIRFFCWVRIKLWRGIRAQSE